MADQPIIVKPNQGLLDSLSATARLLLIVTSTAPAAALFVRKGDLIGLYDYFHTEPGQALLLALSGLASGAFAIYKSHKRGAQIATVAQDSRVPAKVADVKK